MVAKIAATTGALVGITACGASRASQPPPEPGSGGDIAQDAYLASIHRDVWFDGSDTSTLLRIGTAVCAGLDHDSPIHDIVGMAAANHIPPKQVRAAMQAATKICPQHQAAVEAYYTRTPGVTRHLDATRSPSGRGVAQCREAVSALTHSVKAATACGTCGASPRTGRCPCGCRQSRSTC